ncbi:MAG: zinc-dependent metalloprotease, partial [Gammaproteobacteria bacterium]|nr:zinc-dependent metalloprotease [Gammaproteobacteria bacterium]
QARNGAAAYTIGEMLGELRAAVWSELRSGRSINVYRRNLQRGYLERMEWLMSEEPEATSFFSPGYMTQVDVPQSDIRPFVRGELATLKGEINRALGRRLDRAARLHLE